MKKDLLRSLQMLLLVLVMLFGANNVYGAWSEPPSSAPNPNAEAPINVSASGQIKAGGVTLNTSGAESGLIVQKGNVVVGQTSDGISAAMKLFAYGNVGADKYCDRNGQNCHASSEIGGGGPGATYVRSASGYLHVHAFCDPGDAATGGGPRNQEGGDTHASFPIKADGTAPADGETPTGWSCTTENIDKCFVVCLNTNTNPAPIVDISANPTAVSACGRNNQPLCSTNLSWTTSGATSCSASGNWSGNKPTSGTNVPTTWNGGRNGVFTLTCLGDSGSGADTVTVTYSN